MKSIALFLCIATAAANAQILHPMSTMGMGPMLHTGMRYPGMMQTSQYNSMTYPTWRNHIIYRMAPAVSEKTMGTNLPSDVLNIPKVPSTQEVLTHMALANPNPKPYLDTISDFFYEPQKARTVLTPVASVSSVGTASVAPAGPPVYVQGMNLMRANPNYGDDCGPQEGRWERGMDWLY